MPGSCCLTDCLFVCLFVCLFFSRLSLIVHHKMYPAVTPARASSRPDALCSSFSSSSPFSISSHLHPDPHPVYISISRPSELALPFVHNVCPSVRLSVRRPASSAHLSPYVQYIRVHIYRHLSQSVSSAPRAPSPLSVSLTVALHAATYAARPPASLTPPDHDHDIEFPAAPVAYFLPFLSTSFLFFSVFFLFDLV